MTNPKVSVLLPTARRQQWVHLVLRMMAEQTRQPDEIVIVNSGDPFTNLPSNAREVKAIKKGFPEQNGQSILEATGDIMIFMDDDDYYAPTRIERQIEPIIAGRATVTGMKMYYYVEVPAMKWYHRPPDALPGSPKGWNVPFFEGSGCFTREVLRHFTKPEMARIWRTPFINKLKEKGERMEVIPNKNGIIRVQHMLGSTGDQNCYTRDLSKWVKTQEPVGEIPSYVTDFWKKGGNS